MEVMALHVVLAGLQAERDDVQEAPGNWNGQEASTAVDSRFI